MQRVAIGIGDPQHPRWIGGQANRLAGGVEPEAPRLCVVHRGGRGGCRHQFGQHLLQKVSRRGIAAGRVPRSPVRGLAAAGLLVRCTAVGRQRTKSVMVAAHLCFLFHLNSATVAGLK
jgi:hypothetical protein